MKFFLANRLLWITALLIISSIAVPSPFHFHHYDMPPVALYFIITAISLLIYLSDSDKFIFIEKLFYAALLSIFALFIGGLLVEKTMGLLYGYDLNCDELKSPALLDNTLFFCVSNFIGIAILKIWIKYKRPIYPPIPKNDIT